MAQRSVVVEPRGTLPGTPVSECTVIMRSAARTQVTFENIS